MRRLFILAASLILPLFAGAGLLAALNSRNSSPAYYVDYDKGDDANSGRSRDSAWKHAPGDARAQGRAAKTTLQPGDQIIFAAGVRYRSSITPRANGKTSEPIVFSGEAGRPAVVDGSDPAAEVRRCRSRSECGNAEQWQRLSRITFRQPLGENAALFTNQGPLYPAQWPNPADFFYRDEEENFFTADGSRLSEGVAELPNAAAEAISGAGNVTLALWVKPNRVVYRPVTRLEGNHARFDPAKLQFYTDRPSRLALRGHPNLIDQPKEFAILPDGRTAVAWLPAGATGISAASGREGFDLSGSSNIVIRNLTFENMADDGHRVRSGIAIGSRDLGASGIRIEKNRFANMVMPLGQGVIDLMNARDVAIDANAIDGISLGSGIRISGQSGNIRVTNNALSKIGRTGIMLMGTDGAVVTGNVIEDVRGVHGNGFSAYSNSRNIEFAFNTVTNAKQAATLRASENIRIANNFLSGTSGAIGVLVSWGNNRNLTVSRNIIFGGRNALRLSSHDVGVEISANIIDGWVTTGGTSNGWEVHGNAFTRLSHQQKRQVDGGWQAESLRAVVASLGRGRPPAAICDVVNRPGAVAKDRRGGRIGARLACE